MAEIDKVDILILAILKEKDSVSPLYSTQVKDIVNVFPNPIAYYTIVRRLQRLIERELVSEGYKNGNAKTFYLSQMGYGFIDEMLKKENAYVNIDNNENEEESLC